MYWNISFLRFFIKRPEDQEIYGQLKLRFSRDLKQSLVDMDTGNQCPWFRVHVIKESLKSTEVSETEKFLEIRYPSWDVSILFHFHLICNQHRICGVYCAHSYVATLFYLLQIRRSSHFQHFRGLNDIYEKYITWQLFIV